MYHKKNVDFAYLLWEDFVYQVEHKDAKKSNEGSQRDDQMFTTIKLVSRHQNTQQFGAILPIELTNEDIKNSVAYKEYYAIASGAAPPKTKASIRKTQSSFDTTITPPTAAGTRLSTSAKCKQPTKSSKAKGLSVMSEVAMTEAEQINLATKRSLQQTHISQPSGSGVDEGTGILPEVPDIPTDDLGMNVGGEEGQDAEDDDEELYRDVNINLEGRDIQMTDVHTTQEFEDTHATLTLVNPDGQQQISSVDVQASTTVAALTLTAPTLPHPTIPTIFQVPQAPTPPTTAPSTFLNLYKALVDAYECDKIILDTYGDIVTLKRHRDEADKDKEPSVGSDRRSKRRREGKEPESTSAPKEKASKTTGKSIEGDLAKQADSRSSFDELMDTPVDFSTFLMNRLKVDTLTLKFLAGPTYELMKGSCKSLVELEFFLEEVYKATTDQLDWSDPEGHQYLHNLLKPLPLIPNSRGHRVIPFDHLINNDL
nr:hypothetical protein [Tanacetum cinerariifolium]